MNALTTILNDVNEVQAELDQETAKTFLRLAKGNKAVAFGLYATGNVVGTAMNIAIIKKLNKSGWTRTAQSIQAMTVFGTLINIPRQIRVIDNIFNAK